jgi:Tfp pilus assembly protein PilN
MTATSERSLPTQVGSTPGGYTPPRVNLLPPEIYASRAVGRLKRYLALGLVLVVVMSGGGYAFANSLLSAQQRKLADADARTMALTASQTQYAEVPVVLSRLEALKQARELGMSTETLWLDYLGAVFAVMPGGVRVASIKVAGATPMLAPAPPADPLQGDSVTQLDLTGISATLPDVATWQDQLEAVPGFEDVWVSVVTVGEDEDDNQPRFELALRVQVTDEAYANRFLPAEGEG